ncbi:Hypp8569 [Branchiostoma lanceolatum]|uniref:Hypp8569 protein n=1 Tax=Branchiostoma lanceolatum TaxID=7740 RepID=A0A8J9Z9J3_BRALA|nr:Hypp8569 [Branchiostoma lanceolatum]
MWRQQLTTEQIFREDKERETYRDVREGEEHGKLPFNRSKVLFVGDTWQGKTSLKKRLTGQAFDPHEGRTEGIQTRMVETQDVDQTWATSHHTESDFSRSLAWFVTQRSRKRPKKGATKDLSSLVQSALFYFVMSFLTVATLEFGSKVGYAVASLLLTCAVAMMKLNSDFYHATRIASAIAVNSVFIGVMKNGVESLYRSIGPVLSVGPFSLQGLVFCVSITFVFCITEGFVVFPFTCRIMHIMLCLVAPCPEFGAVGLLHRFWTAQTPASHVFQDAFLYEPLGSVIGLTMFQFRHILIKSMRGTFLSYLLFSLATIVLPVMIIDERLEACMLMFLVGLHLGIGISCTIKAQKWLSSKMTAQYFWVVQLISFPVQVATMLGIVNLFGWRFYTFKDCPPSVLVAVVFFVSTDLYDKKSVFFNSEYVVVHNKLAEEEALSAQVPVKLTLMDFAGDEDFYSMHHFFMAREAVYIVVFSLAEAARGPHNTFRRLLFWLDSIDAHSDDRDSLVFLVGTHRDSVTSSQRQDVATFLRTHLYTETKYSARLVVNTRETPYFPVENSASLQDPDFARLRKVMWEKMKQVAYMKRECPIKWQRFSDVIDTLRSNKDPHVVPYHDLLDRVRKEGILDDEDDFRRMLSFFDRSGQVIHRLVDAMKSITTLPRLCGELPTYRERYALLTAKGILDGDFLTEVLNEVKPDHAEVLTTLLVSHDFLCPLP